MFKTINDPQLESKCFVINWLSVHATYAASWQSSDVVDVNARLARRQVQIILTERDLQSAGQDLVPLLFERRDRLRKHAQLVKPEAHAVADLRRGRLERVIRLGLFLLAVMLPYTSTLQFNSVLGAFTFTRFRRT